MASAYGGLVRLTVNGEDVGGLSGLDFRLEGSCDGKTWGPVTPGVAMRDYQSVAISFTMKVPRSTWARRVARGRAELAMLWRMLKR